AGGEGPRRAGRREGAARRARGPARRRHAAAAGGAGAPWRRRLQPGATRPDAPGAAPGGRGAPAGPAAAGGGPGAGPAGPEEARAAADAERVERGRDLATVRRQVQELGEEQARLTDVVHRDEVARAEQRMRIDALRARSVEELGIEPDALVAEYGPDQLVPP